MRAEGGTVAAAVDPAVHQPRSLQHLHVLGSGSQRHRQWRRELPNRQLAPGQPAQHAPAGIVRQRMAWAKPSTTWLWFWRAPH